MYFKREKEKDAPILYKCNIIIVKSSIMWTFLFLCELQRDILMGMALIGFLKELVFFLAILFCLLQLHGYRGKIVC